jgi:trigger factor
VTKVEELAPNRVRLTVDVSPHQVEHAVEHAANDLAGSLKIPGFRQGKVPMPVLLSRVGKERVYAEAIESHIGGWFWNAAAEQRLRPVAQPEYDFELPDSPARGWSFTATVDVQPRPQLPGDWKALEVPRLEPDVPAELVEQELERLRQLAAELSPVDGRPAQLGDTAVLDLVGEGGESHRDYVVELGSMRLVEEIEQGVVGMSAGETRTVEFELADDAVATVEVTLKELKEKVLPPLDDELARAASEFETLGELSASVEAKLREQLEEEAEGQFRAAVADALVQASGVEAAGPFVEARTRELLNGMVRSVESRGIPFETYLQLTGTEPEQLVDRLRAEAKQSVGREIVLEAVAEKLSLEVSDEEVERVIREQAAELDENADEAVRQVRESGGFERLREDLRLREALTRVAAGVTPISTDLAAAREKLWTPAEENAPAETKLWTPGSKEPA